MPHAETTAGLKRVFIKPEYQGKGLGRKLVTEICGWARDEGFNRMILETGTPLVAAHALYEKFGFSLIPNYGQYRGMKDSICMEKSFGQQELKEITHE